MKRTRVLAGALAVVAAGIDQLTKQWALSTLPGSPIELFPAVRLAVTYNDGVSFSAGGGSGRIIAVVVIAVVGYLLWLMARQERPAAMLILGVAAGGALGNLADRVFRAGDGFLSGHVVDFIDVSWFAVFNVADIFVVVGTIAFAVTELVVERRLSRTPQRADRGLEQ